MNRPLSMLFASNAINLWCLNDRNKPLRILIKQLSALLVTLNLLAFLLDTVLDRQWMPSTS